MLYQSMWVTVPGLEPRIDPLYNYGQVLVSSDFCGSMGRTFLYAIGPFSLSFTGDRSSRCSSTASAGGGSGRRT